MKKPAAAKSNPPPHLSAAAKALWKRVQLDYLIDDAAGLALLTVAAEAFERAEDARLQIKRDGAVLIDRFGQKKVHPATSIERDARGQFISAIRALRLAPEVEQ